VEIFEITSAMVGNRSALPKGASKQSGLSIALGFFDGVHLGHANVIQRAVAFAKERGQIPAVMTFDPHPRVVLGKGNSYQAVLTPLEDKLDLFGKMGVESVYIIRFNEDFARITAQRFVEELLVPLHVRTAVCGFDFRFGHRGEGDADCLAKHGGGMDVHIIDRIMLDEDKVSSSRIRAELAAGNCELAARLLGRPYTIKGYVVHGNALGRQIGFPTANVEPASAYVIPRTGVYTITAEIMDEGSRRPEVYGGVLNIGRRPTIEAAQEHLTLEAHLFDFSGDLYGRRMSLELRKFLREERKFDSVQDLIRQIEKDAAEARRLLAELVR
jgi:riboflavin kinase/FMN adenylyltransferase